MKRVWLNPYNILPSGVILCYFRLSNYESNYISGKYFNGSFQFYDPTTEQYFDWWVIARYSEIV